MKLVVISAPSGAGKTSLCSRLLQDFPELVLSVSSTTRKPRGKEKEGEAYFFLTEGEFKKRIQENRFLEWALVYGNYYGTSKDFIDQTLAAKKSVLLDIDVQGAESIRKAYPKNALTVFIAPPSLEVLEERLRARGTDSEAAIKKRVETARIEMQEQSRFHAIVINDDFEQAYQKLKALVKKELRS